MILNEVKVGRFISRPVDSFTSRTGVNTYHHFQAIHALDKSGRPSGDFVCYVRCDPARPVREAEQRVRALATLLDAGAQASDAAHHDQPPTAA